MPHRENPEDEIDPATFTDDANRGSRWSSITVAERLSNSRSQVDPDRDHLEDQESARNDNGEYDGYQAPRQISKWGAPGDVHVDWGDLFFDLLYVAATFKVGDLLTENFIFDNANERLKKETETGGIGGLFYTTGIGLALSLAWHEKVQLQARFESGDIFHFCFSVLDFLVVGHATFYIPAEFSREHHDREMYIPGFSYSMAFFFTLQCARYLELLTLAGRREHIDSGRLTPGTIAYARQMLYANFAVIIIFFAAALLPELPVEGISYLAVATLWWASVLVYIGFKYYHLLQSENMTKLPGGAEAYKLVSVPIAMTYLIHRFGEWIMLLQGEGVLSLLLLDVEKDDPFEVIAVGSGMLMIVLLNFQVFSTYPSNSETHAMRRSRKAGFKYVVIIQFVLPMILVGIIVATKVLVKLKHYEDDDHYPSFSYIAQGTFFGGLALCHFFVNWLAQLHTHGLMRFIISIKEAIHKTGGSKKSAYLVIGKFLTCVVLLVLAPMKQLRPLPAINIGLLIVFVQAFLMAAEDPGRLKKADHDHEKFHHASTHQDGVEQEWDKSHPVASGSGEKLHGKRITGSSFSIESPVGKGSADQSEFDVSDVY